VQYEWIFSMIHVFITNFMICYWWHLPLFLLVPTQNVFSQKNAEVIFFTVLTLSEAKGSTWNILASLDLWWWQHSQFTDELHLNINSPIKTAILCPIYGPFFFSPMDSSKWHFSDLLQLTSLLKLLKGLDNVQKVTDNVKRCISRRTLMFQIYK